MFLTTVKWSATLDEISPTFCKKELGWADVHQLIAEIERRNLFIQSAGPALADETYRFNPLFREFLLTKFRKDDACTYKRLQQDVGAAYERIGQVELAAQHFIDGGCSADLLRLVVANAPAYLDNGRNQVVLDWITHLDEIEPDARLQNPILWQYKILAYLNTGQESFAIETLDELEKLAQNSMNPQFRYVFSSMLAKIDWTSVSPFVVTGPTPLVMFVGRETELRIITQRASHSSFAVVGGRRIGKSSMLIYLHRVRLPEAGYQSLYIDCSGFPSYDAFMSARAIDWQPNNPHASLVCLDDVLRSLPSNRPLVVLLDEADRSIEVDRSQGWPIFRSLRATANSHKAQFVFGGERLLRDALRDSTSPLFNFPSEILLGPLDYEAVRELVKRPLQRLNITLENEEGIVQQIYEFTSGHPSVVQRFCNRLLERLNDTGVRRITSNDVFEVFEPPIFQEEDFLATYWDRATPLEQIIALLMADHSRPLNWKYRISNLMPKKVKTYKIQDILRLLHSFGIQPESVVVKAALDRLVDLRSLLRRNRTGYEISVKAFPDVIRRTIDVGDLLISLKVKYLSDPEEIIS